MTAYNRYTELDTFLNCNKPTGINLMFKPAKCGAYICVSIVTPDAFAPSPSSKGSFTPVPLEHPSSSSTSLREAQLQGPTFTRSQVRLRNPASLFSTGHRAAKPYANQNAA